MAKVWMAATHNPKKLLELQRILAPLGIEVQPFPDKAVLASIVEDGETFAENAAIKAKAVFAACGLPTLADDSGLCIAALDGKPGVHSARFLGENTPYTVKNAEVLRLLQHLPPEQRGAKFVSAIALMTDAGLQIFEGECHGRIGDAPKGEHGFGYDPIFYVGGESFATLSDAEKDAISHRGRALQQLFDALSHQPE